MLKKMLFFFFIVCAPLSAAPQAVIFDFGGVLTREPDRKAFVDFLQTSFHLSEADWEQINKEKKKAIVKGQTDLEFWLQYAKRTNSCLPDGWTENFLLVMKKAIGFNFQMYALVYQLKENGITVGLLSNIDKRLADLIGDFGGYEPFDPCLLSYELGIEKPDPRIYEILLKTINLPAKEVVFIDDKQENVDAAKKLGIDALLFYSQQQLIEELKKRNLKL